MNYIVLDDPLKAIEPSGFKGLTVPLNIAESIIRSAIGQKVELLDLSETFNLGHKAVFENGRVVDWEVIPVF